jgi:hypothetical protein
MNTNQTQIEMWEKIRGEKTKQIEAETARKIQLQELGSDPAWFKNLNQNDGD